MPWWRHGHTATYGSVLDGSTATCGGSSHRHVPEHGVLLGHEADRLQHSRIVHLRAELRAGHLKVLQQHACAAEAAIGAASTMIASLHDCADAVCMRAVPSPTPPGMAEAHPP
jgi:hypothetical protein|eukprot:7378463-Prymnesium_polylepis.2